jgi:hypothetical protein
MPTVVAHVLHLDHTPAVAAVRAIGRAGVDPLVITQGTQARVILGLDPCKLCNGLRRCPDCGGPCEVCSVPASRTDGVR